MGISAYGGGFLVILFFERRCSPDYFSRNVNKMAVGFPIIKKDKRNNVYCWILNTKINANEEKASIVDIEQIFRKQILKTTIYRL